MSGKKHYPNILMPNRRELLLSAAALGAGAAISASVRVGSPA
jgi:hypothetical protein